jgi:vacuolar-type H+-ATPase subunit H
MRDRSATTTAPSISTAGTPDPGERFRKRLFRGYDVDQVDDALARVDLQLRDLEVEAADLREELLAARNDASETRHDLTRAKAELRYWNDRASYVDSEVARARRQAAELEETARNRADTIEADAQARSLQLIDSVCEEANAMLQHAREEAREMFLRFESDVDMSQQKLVRLEEARDLIASTMQNALRQFEDAVREMNKVGPIEQIVAAIEEPTRRAVPTFGQRKALDHAKRFAEQAEHTATPALSSPLPSVLGVSVHDVDDTEAESEAIELAALPEIVVDPTAPSDVFENEAGTDIPVEDADDEHAQGPSAHRSHDADEEFAALMLQP